MIVLLASIFLGLDLCTKWLAYIYLADPIVITDFFQLQLSINPGVAFSIPLPNILLILISPLVMSGFIWFMFRECNTRESLTRVILALFIAGGVGNIISRLFVSGVIDFIDFSFWPSFNLADLYLTTGAFLLIAFHGRIIKKN